MTTSTNITILDIDVPEVERIASEKQVPREINDLIDVPYSEMSEEEIALVVQYKADMQTRDRMHSETMARITEALWISAAANMEMANKAQDRLDELTAHAIARFENES